MLKIPNFPTFLALSVIGTASLMPLLVLPAMIGVLVDNAGMSDASAGWSASSHFVAGALIGLAMAVRIHHLNLRLVATFALTLAMVGDIGSGLTAGDPTAFFAARIFCGAMLGAVYIATVSAFARIDGYDRGFGLFVTLQFIVSGLGLYIVPVYADVMGADGLFFGLAGIDALALMLVRALPAEKPAQPDASESTSELKVLLTLPAIIAAVGFALFEAANNAQFTYVERFGVALEVSDPDIGFSLLIASLLGIPGAFCIVMTGDRFGTMAPLTIGMAIAIVGLVILFTAQSYPMYFLGSCCMGFSWAFCLPYIQSLLAGIDRKGSAVAAGSSLSTFGSAFGPAMAALVVMDGQYANVFLLSIVLFIVTLTAFYFANRLRTA